MWFEEHEYYYVMLFKDADVERKFFQRFLFDDENDDDDEEDNIVDKTLIKWTRAPKTVAREERNRGRHRRRNEE